MGYRGLRIVLMVALLICGCEERGGNDTSRPEPASVPEKSVVPEYLVSPQSFVMSIVNATEDGKYRHRINRNKYVGKRINWTVRICEPQPNKEGSSNLRAWLFLPASVPHGNKYIPVARDIEISGTVPTLSKRELSLLKRENKSEWGHCNCVCNISGTICKFTFHGKRNPLHCIITPYVKITLADASISAATADLPPEPDWESINHRSVQCYQPPGPKHYSIVYLVECSGSMIDTFWLMKRELMRSVYKLDGDCKFHMIFFGGEESEEGAPRKLVRATRSNKKAAINFFKEQVPEGMGYDPLPAFRRAFEVIEDDPKGQGLIYLLADGKFCETQTVLDLIDEVNPYGLVRIYPYLYGNKSPDFVKAMKLIAEKTGGTHMFVEPY